MPRMYGWGDAQERGVREKERGYSTLIVIIDIVMVMVMVMVMH